MGKQGKLTFAVVVLFIMAAMAMVCSPLIGDCISILQTGCGSRQYLAIGAGQSGICAVSQEKNGFRFTFGTADGKRQGSQTADLPEAAAGSVAGVYPAADGIYLPIYLPEAGTGAAANLALYRLPREGAPERLLLQPCTGDTPAQRMADCRISGFTEQDGQVSFALFDQGMVQAYHTSEEGGLYEGQSCVADGAVCAAMLSDGSIALGGKGMLTIDGQPVWFPVENQIVTQLTQVGSGFFYIDSASFDVFFNDLTGTEAVQAFSLDTMLDKITGMAFLPDGRLLILRDGHQLQLVQESGSMQLNRLLYHTPAACVLILIGLLFVVLVLAVLVWGCFCAQQQGYLPLVVRWGSLTALAVLVCGLVLYQICLRPAIRGNLAKQAENILSLAAAEQDDLDHIAAGLLQNGDYAGAKATAYDKMFDGWYISRAAGGLPAGSRAGLSPGFSVHLAEQAKKQGEAFAWQPGSIDFYLNEQGEILRISVPDQMLAARAAAQQANAVIRMAAGLGLLWFIFLLALLLIGHRVRTLAYAMELVAAGEEDIPRLYTGDELEGMSASLASMANGIRQQKEQQQGLIRAYLRFVPEQVLRLLGRSSILEVDRHTLAVRQMSVMTVWFAFPERVYDHNTRALFDSINEIIERTSAIIAQKGGTVFNFSHSGYHVALEGQPEQAVSTAVAIQQEILSINEQRMIRGVPPVTLRIALDVGEVMFGIVGDESQMEPTTISSSFTIAQGLIALCSRLDAGILCTENVIAGAEQYGNRYMGKSIQGGSPVRVYEIYDGDVYSLRRDKETAGKKFAQGVFSLYSRDFVTAKRIFLELVHDNPRDGGARYYLYLADQLEKNPAAEISLEL